MDPAIISLLNEARQISFAVYNLEDALRNLQPVKGQVPSEISRIKEVITDLKLHYGR